MHTIASIGPTTSLKSPKRLTVHDLAPLAFASPSFVCVCMALTVASIVARMREAWSVAATEDDDEEEEEGTAEGVETDADGGCANDRRSESATGAGSADSGGGGGNAAERIISSVKDPSGHQRLRLTSAGGSRQ